MPVSDEDLTPSTAQKFDFDAFSSDTLFLDRRQGRDRRSVAPSQPEATGAPVSVPERRERKERRRRIDPTTFEKQYTPDELEFMNAMQQFKVQSCKTFPTHREVIKVAVTLGYRKPEYSEST
jgi:hypothetical protein